MRKADPQTKVVYFDGSRADDNPTLVPWLADAGIAVEVVKIRDGEREIVRMSEQIKQRSEQDTPPSPIVIVIDPLERFRDLRQDEGFSFSLDAAASGPGGSAALQTVLREGPPANVFVVLVCGSVETLSRWLPRASQHDLELRVLGQMNASDSALLIDSPIASDLSAATMLLYDDSDGRIAKFRQCDLPNPATVRTWLEGSSLLG
jgi:S-DNA-T family DNA segregation ATPase FtsK/SpoIIIE